MKYLKILLWSNIPMALEALSWAILSYLTLPLKIDKVILILVFSLTWLFYTRDRLNISESDKINNPERTYWYEHQLYLKTLIHLTLLIVLTCVILRTSVLIPTMIGIVPCLLYTKRFSYKSHSFSLKSLPGMKVILVSFLWVLLTLLFPLAAANASFFLNINPKLLYLSLMMGCFVMLQIHTNDMRDTTGDAQERIRSFAVLLGSKNARLFGIGLAVVGTCFGCMVFPPVLMSLYGLFLIIRTLLYKKEQDIYFQAFISFQALILLILVIAEKYL